MEGAPPRLIAHRPRAGRSRVRADRRHGRRARGGGGALQPAVSAGRGSTYDAANVSIASGGRLVLSRIFAALGPARIGYQTPDYTAYEDMFDYHRHRITPVHVPTREADGFVLTPGALERAIAQHELCARSSSAIRATRPAA